ncbi:MAG: hydrogenase small subunit [Chloroflexota bacterium]
MDDDGLYTALIRRGMTRRSFLKLSSAMAAALALPASYAPRIAEAISTAPRLPVIWLRGQTCGGNTEALLRGADPTFASLLLDVISVEYHQSLLSTAGEASTVAISEAMARYPNGYVLVVEGAIPKGAGGAYCLTGGRPIADVVKEVSDGALATIAAGSCACDGGIEAASGGLTDADGIKSLVSGNLIALPGCPLNVVNLAAVIVHYLTFRDWPARDQVGRPLAAYGSLIHNQCERRPHFEFGEFALAWGDEGAQRGWCLYKLGCKGPETIANCPTARYSAGTSWNVRAGAGCVGCVAPRSWDAMGPAYTRLPPPVGLMPGISVDVAGGAIVGGIAGVVVVHSTGMAIRYKRRGRIARKEAAAAAAAADAEKEAAAGGAVALATGPAPSAATPVAATPVAATPVAATQTDTAAQAEALAGTGVDDQDNVEPRA